MLREPDGERAKPGHFLCTINNLIAAVVGITNKARHLWRALFVVMVGAKGFEPSTSQSRTERSTKLSHAPPTERNYTIMDVARAISGSI